MGAGINLFAKQTLANSYFSYGTTSVGTTLKVGIPLSEELSTQLRYSIFTQSIDLPWYLDDCNNLNPDGSTSFATLAAINAPGSPFAGQTSCMTYGQASLPIRAELAGGATIASMVGYEFRSNSLDNNKNPTSGINISVGQDFAGVGGNVSYMRSTADLRSYYEIVSDLVSVVHLQAGNMLGLGSDGVRMLDDFKMGRCVRGFQPPRASGRVT